MSTFKKWTTKKYQPATLIHQWDYHLIDSNQQPRLNVCSGSYNLFYYSWWFVRTVLISACWVSKYVLLWTIQQPGFEPTTTKFTIKYLSIQTPQYTWNTLSAISVKKSLHKTIAYFIPFALIIHQTKGKQSQYEVCRRDFIHWADHLAIRTYRTPRNLYYFSDY